MPISSDFSYGLCCICRQPTDRICSNDEPQCTVQQICVVLDRVEHIPGAAVEHNKFCVSVHFRNCSPESYEHVVTAVKDTLNDHPNLKASRGRKVLEIQPQVRAYATMGPL